MDRCESFQPENEPFRHHEQLQLQEDKVGGPLWFMNPTRARFTYLRGSETSSDTEGSAHAEGAALQGADSKRNASVSCIEYKWTSRNNRKGRHTLVLHESYDGQCPYATSRATTTPKSILSGIWRMFTIFIFSDVSYLLAVTFTAACVVLVANAVLTFLPYARPDVELPNDIAYVEASLSALGCIAFLVGSFWAFTEAVNANRKGCFGWRLEHVTYADARDAGMELGDIEVLVPDGSCNHHHDTRQVLYNQSESWVLQGTDEKGIDKTKHPHSSAEAVKAPWRWFPSGHELRTHMIYDIGFVTSCILLVSSFVYCSASIAALTTTAKTGIVARWIRIPQMVAAFGFAVSSALFGLETQSAWLRPELKALGWHLSLWNFIGSLGFLLTALFGFTQSMPEAQFWFGCCFLWGASCIFYSSTQDTNAKPGSLAFLIGSVLQWYESLGKDSILLCSYGYADAITDKYPVEIRKDR